MTGPEGWRWLFWVLTIFGGASTIVLFFTLPETYAPIILRDKAQKIRKETGDSLVYAAIEKEDRRILKLLKITLSRPFQLLFGDIIIFLVCLYLSFCYGVQYLFFQVDLFVELSTHLGIPDHLPGHPPLEPRWRRTRIRCRRHWIYHRLRCISILGLSTSKSSGEIPGRSIGSSSQNILRTSTTASHHDSRAVLHHRLFLAWMDVLSFYPSNCPDVIWTLLWSGELIPVCWIFQLSDGLLLLRCECIGCKHHYAEHFWGWISTLYTSDV